ncbi:Retrotransposon-derived protein PEG10, partial [Ophiophagus hannah]
MKYTEALHSTVFLQCLVKDSQNSQVCTNLSNFAEQSFSLFGQANLSRHFQKSCRDSEKITEMECKGELVTKSGMGPKNEILGAAQADSESPSRESPENLVRKQVEPDLGETLGRTCTGLESCPAEVDSGPPWHLILVAQVFLANSSQGIPVHALVDSGATTNFMDVAFAAQYAIPQYSVELPLLVETIDGRVLLSGPIKAAIQPLHLTIGSHEEAIQFYLISRLHFPVILGLAWLWTHDPQIYWSQK